MIQTDFANTIKDLLAKFDDNFKESLKETIADQSVKFDAKLEKQQQTLSFQIIYYSTKFPFKLDDQDNKISSFTEYYNERLNNMSANNKFSTKIEIGKTEIEATMNMRLD